MSKPAARVGDMHTCPMVDPGPKPHVGGPILPPGCPTVIIAGMPAARVGDMVTCLGPPDTIAVGSPTVMIGNMMAARLGDQTAHGGVITVGCPTVNIGFTAGVPSLGIPAVVVGNMAQEEVRRLAQKLEALDNSHSLDRHGPEIFDQKLKDRLTTGIAPDGKYSPSPGSTRFKSYADWLQTREEALAQIAALKGIDLSKPPPKGKEGPFNIVIDHNRPIDDGYVGSGQKVKVADPQSGKEKKVFTNTQYVKGLSRTITTIEWNPSQNRWVVKQHYPSSKNWDQTSGKYTK